MIDIADLFSTPASGVLDFIQVVLSPLLVLSSYRLKLVYIYFSCNQEFINQIKNLSQVALLTYDLGDE